jgi:hypothetical protein
MNSYEIIEESFSVPNAPATEALAVAEMMSRFLNVQGSERLAMFEKALSIKAPEYLPMLATCAASCPVNSKVAVDRPGARATYAARDLLHKYGSTLTLHKFNSLAMDCGLLEIQERPSETREGSMRACKVVSGLGLQYGCNVAPKRKPKNLRPVWFEDTFLELLDRLEG